MKNIRTALQDQTKEFSLENMGAKQWLQRQRFIEIVIAIDLSQKTM